MAVRVEVRSVPAYTTFRLVGVSNRLHGCLPITPASYPSHRRDRKTPEMIYAERNESRKISACSPANGKTLSAVCNRGLSAPINSRLQPAQMASRPHDLVL